MPINKTEALNIVQQVTEEANINVTVKESGKGALLAGACAFAGGLLAGPVGLGIGGIVGAVGAAYRSAGKFKSVAEVIQYEMTPAQRDSLAASVQRIVNDLRVEDVAIILTMIMSDTSIKAVLLNEVGKFLRNEMGLALTA